MPKTSAYKSLKRRMMGQDPQPAQGQPANQQAPPRPTQPLPTNQPSRVPQKGQDLQPTIQVDRNVQDLPDGLANTQPPSGERESPAVADPMLVAAEKVKAVADPMPVADEKVKTVFTAEIKEFTPFIAEIQTTLQAIKGEVEDFEKVPLLQKIGLNLGQLAFDLLVDISDLMSEAESGKRTRDETLNLLKAARPQISDNPVLKHLDENPFYKAALQSLLAQAFTALEDKLAA